MKTDLFKEIKETFDKNMDSVNQLMNFDRILLDFCIGQIETLDSRLKSNDEIKLTNVIHLPTGTISALKAVRENDSMRIEYQGIFNQCMVLTVSHFSSVIHSIFIKTINHASQYCPDLLTATNEDIKITFSELKGFQFNLSESLGDLIVKKKNVSFQDMQSTHRSFETFFNIKIHKDIITNNIIVAQAARHSIVHAASKADEKFLSQISDASPREIMLEIHPNDVIQFSTSEIEQVQKSMATYVVRLIETIENRILKLNAELADLLNS